MCHKYDDNTEFLKVSDRPDRELKRENYILINFINISYV